VEGFNSQKNKGLLN